MIRHSHFRHFRYNLSRPLFKSGITQYSVSFFIIILCSALCYLFEDFLGYQSVSFILLFAVSILAVFMGIGPIMMASFISAFIWNFFFISPRFTIHVEKTEDALMLGMFFIIALVNGILTSRVRRQEKLARDREKQTRALYHLTRGLANSTNMEQLLAVAVRDIKEHFGDNAVFILQDGCSHLFEYVSDNERCKLSSTELGLAESAFSTTAIKRIIRSDMAESGLTFYPLTGNSIKPGVLALYQNDFSKYEKNEFWDTFLTQISNAVEREFLNELARKARFLDESDKLYKTLFNSLSHELRIPVSTIMGASDSLTTSEHTPEIRKELSGEIYEASKRLNRLIDNLLNMSRIESGRISPRKDWCDVNDLINKVSEDLKDELRLFNLISEIPADMPFVMIDFGLMEQVLYNLIYNATQYAQPETNIRVKVFYDQEVVTFLVMDRGPGFAEKEISLVFNKFYRVEGSKAGGTGLGLSIVKGFVEAHKGSIIVENRQNGGAVFTLSIPSELSNMEIKT